jgi:hypothetical protein
LKFGISDLFLLPIVCYINPPALSSFLCPLYKEWQLHIKNFSSLVDLDLYADSLTTTAQDLDDFNVEVVHDVLVPVLTDSDPLPDLLYRRFRVGPNPTGGIITLLVREITPLNEKQGIVVEKVMSEVLSTVTSPHNPSP